MQSIQPENIVIPGLSQAMLVESGKLLFLSGHTPLDLSGNVVGKDLASQMVQVFENLKCTLAAASVGFESVARLTIYVCNYHPDQLSIIREVRDRYINSNCPPASALIGVASLFSSEVLVEIDAIAVIP